MNYDFLDISDNNSDKLSIDINFKMNSDTPRGKDPDTFSRTLQSYHQLLWSKPLPSGRLFNLKANKNAPYFLYHTSDLGDYRLASDSIVHTYIGWKRMPIADIVKAIPAEDIGAFYDLAHTIGGYIVFPANRINQMPTINIIRGMHPRLNDRFDLALECIRRWYIGMDSPLSIHLERYRNFFELFNEFDDYIDYFLLNDLIDPRSKRIKFWLPFTEFGESSALPKNIHEYTEYMKNIIEFTKSRNERISIWVGQKK